MANEYVHRTPLLLEKSKNRTSDHRRRFSLSKKPKILLFICSLIRTFAPSFFKPTKNNKQKWKETSRFSISLNRNISDN